MITIENHFLGKHTSYFKSNISVVLLQKYEAPLTGYEYWVGDIMYHQRFQQAQEALHPEFYESKYGDKCH